jgi:hypothetical protein
LLSSVHARYGLSAHRRIMRTRPSALHRCMFAVLHLSFDRPPPLGRSRRFETRPSSPCCRRRRGRGFARTGTECGGGCAGTSERLVGAETQRDACLMGKTSAELRRALGCREPGSTQLLSVPLDLHSLQPLASGRSSLDTALRWPLRERIEDWSMQKVSEQLALRRPQMRPYQSDLAFQSPSRLATWSSESKAGSLPTSE